MPMLPARPRAVEMDLASTAVVVVDMQNAFASPGGTLDLAGIDISGAAAAVANTAKVIAAARRAKLPIVFLQAGYQAGLGDSGGPGSPNWHKETALCLMADRPELEGKLLIEGTWDFAIVDELTPDPGDIVVRKTRYSGFVNTTLDAQLRARGVRTLLFAGIATNVCVESTLRHAFFLDYWPVLLQDCCFQAGPQEVHQATVFNVQSFFGWVTDSGAVVSLLA